MERQPTEERRRQIAKAALKIVAEQGLGKFTTSSIAKEVGLSDGALFRHFKTKAEIVLAAIDLIEEELFRGFPPKREDPLEALGELIKGRLDYLSENPYLFRLIFSEQLTQASGRRGTVKIQEMRTKTLEFIRNSLKAAQATGSVRDDLSPDDLTVIVFGTVFGAAGRELYEGVLPKASVRGLSGRLWTSLEKLIRR